MPGRFNRFQQAMLAWDELHPYNAVHVIRVRSAPDPPRLETAIRTTIESWGIASLTIDDSGRRYRYCGGPAAVELKVIEGGLGALAVEIERQLNTPFVRAESFQPFRCFVAPGPDAFLLGLAYFHPVADAESVVGLLKAILDVYAGRLSPGTAGSVELYPAGPPLRAPGWIMRQLLALPGLIRMTRTCCRPHYRNAQDLRNGFTGFALEPPALDALRGSAKAWGVTFNDLLLAILLKALAPLARTRRKGARRKIAAGCVVNLRNEPGATRRDAFGLFLGSFIVAHEAPEDAGLGDLAAAIARQTRRIKRQRLYLGTPLQLAVAAWALRFFSTRRKRSFYQKHWPLWGGITNMNLNTLWDPARPDGPVDYWRAVSTGPVTPLALSVTTVAERINIGLSYRSTVYAAPEIQELQCRFLGIVAGLGAGS